MRDLKALSPAAQPLFTRKEWRRVITETVVYYLVAAAIIASFGVFGLMAMNTPEPNQANGKEVISK